MSLRNLRFDFFDDSGLPRDSRILMFYSFETDENFPRSGILHYHVSERRFVGPRHDSELQAAALDFLARSGRLAGPALLLRGCYAPVIASCVGAALLARSPPRKSVFATRKHERSS